ncbi:MAG: zinc-binding alcohol dehydrogenase [Firmicutes bacterium]|nr:zinc-binding alcohol dehydrogenase [Bacillota bacterium]
MRLGDTVTIIGLGAIGLIAVEMARKAGAETIIAVDPLEPRRKWAKDHGADYVLDPSECDVALEVHHLTSGKGTDISIEVAGSYAALASAIRCTRNMGTVCSAGFYQGEARDLWLGREWHHNRLNIVIPHGCGWGHVPRDYPLWDEMRAYDTMVSLLRKGYLDFSGLIHPVVSLEEGPKVWELIENRPAEVIKYAVKF